MVIIENSWQFSSKKIEILWNFCKIVLNSKIFCCTFSKMLWNCQVLHGSLGKGCGIYCKILLISLQHDLLFMKLLEKRVKLLNFLNVLHQKRKIWPSISLNHHFYGLISKKFEEFLLNFECSISEIHEIVVNFLKIVKFLKVPCAVFWKQVSFHTRTQEYLEISVKLWMF